MNQKIKLLFTFVALSLLGPMECSIIRDSQDCPPGYGKISDNHACVKKIVLPTRKACPEPFIRHGFYKLQLGGRMAKFSCEHGRSLFPSNATHAMCSVFGTWDRDHPKCILTETGGCGELPEEDHLTAFKLKEHEGTFVYGFECDPGFDLIGPLVIRCNGHLWNGTVPGCQKREEDPQPSPIVESREKIKEVQVNEAIILPEMNKGLKQSQVPRKLSEYSRSSGGFASKASSLSVLIALLPGFFFGFF